MPIVNVLPNSVKDNENLNKLIFKQNLPQCLKILSRSVMTLKTFLDTEDIQSPSYGSVQVRIQSVRLHCSYLDDDGAGMHSLLIVYLF